MGLPRNAPMLRHPSDGENTAKPRVLLTGRRATTMFMKIRKFSYHTDFIFRAFLVAIMVAIGGVLVSILVANSGVF